MLKRVIDKQNLVSHIENEYHNWGDQYDIPQVLEDIESMDDIIIEVDQEEEEAEGGLYVQLSADDWADDEE